jgi:hypothetical protein
MTEELLHALALTIKHERIHLTIAWHEERKAFIVNAYTWGSVGQTGLDTDLGQALTKAVALVMGE